MRLPTIIGLILVLAAGLFGFVATEDHSTRRFIMLASLTVLTLATVGLSIWYQKHKQDKLPWISNEDFLSTLAIQPDTSKEFLLRGRDWLAHHFRVSPQRLAPELTLTELAREVDFLGNGYTGLSDIEFELIELYRAAGETPAELGGLTVANAVTELVRLGKEVRPSRIPH